MRIFLVIFFLIYVNIFPQYYSNISTESGSFIDDLKNLIRANYVRITYDNYKNTIIPEYESSDNGDSTRSVTCVYTGYKYNYTPPFTWDVFSREHTWCYSWMPTHGDKTTDEYSDQHHLFPVHQNKANVRRSNHPLGKVVNVTYQFMDGKLGTNANGETVYEPRDEHKGDAARALLYMTIRYDGINGNTWNFDWLNNVKLPELGEAQQNLETLLQWHRQDPPDKWEVERNDYIYSKQHNRNPFVDHPEYVSYINFHNLSKLSPDFAPEPDVQPLDFSITKTDTSITISWDENYSSSEQLPSGYLLLAYEGNNYFIPMDGVVYNEDTDISDGRAIVKIPFESENNFSFTNIDSTKNYFFRIYSYNGENGTINYNIKSPPSVSTEENDETFPTLYFTEYVEGSSYNKALEIYNASGNTINLDNQNYILELYLNGNSSPSKTISLVGNIDAGEVFVIANPNADEAILDVSNQTSSSLTFNGDDAIVLKQGSKILNVIGQIGYDPGTAWGSGSNSTANNTLRIRTNTELDTNPNDEYDPASQFTGYGCDNFDNLGIYDAPTPVELISFTANVNGNNVDLNWQTATEMNNYGFEIQRSTQKATWSKISFVEGNGTSNSPKEYSFTDAVSQSGKYSYRLKQIDIDGSYKYSNVVEVNVSSPEKFELKANYPNPFNPTTTIEYSIPNVGASIKNVQLKIYDVLGREVATLVNEKQSPGNYKVKFDASKLNSGAYFYTLRAGDFVSTKKMILLK